MAGTDNWMDGYVFWKGQYSVRNTIYRMMWEELSSKRATLHESCEGDIGLEMMLFFNLRCFDKIKKSFDNLFPNNKINKKLFKDVKYIEEDISRKFPYASFEESPIEILKTICSGAFPPSMKDEIEDCGIYPNNRSSSVSYRGIDSYGRSLFAIDLTAETNIIIAEMRKIIEEEKQGDDSEDFFDEKDVIALRSELCASGAAYRVGSDESRAVGLLLFDYLEENEASDAEAIRWARKEIANQGLKNFGKADSSDRQFQRWLSNTRRCIEFAEVFEI